MSISKAPATTPERPAVMAPYKPDWLEKPTVDDMEWAYPAHAQRKEIDGKAVITCKVGYDGLLRDCRVVSETPVGEDFGLEAPVGEQPIVEEPAPVEEPVVENLG